ncbi:uncharacterized protein LOC114663258 [Erpetoichthys calabaricus]|uniref:uncharacterized protein LOC114663258 n=1 Tax=Erpetoichthys calabaricus TaxID=27687 RepID=UPI00223451CD|nr:uncharacterized protein LOC114663258 [Erpetoichthys calabaricus]
MLLDGVLGLSVALLLIQVASGESVTLEMDPIQMAFMGEKAKLECVAFVPPNSSEGVLKILHNDMILKSKSIKSTDTVSVDFDANKDMGGYYECAYRNPDTNVKNIFSYLIVQEKDYEEPESFKTAFVLLLLVSFVLLIFNITGTLLLFCKAKICAQKKRASQTAKTEIKPPENASGSIYKSLEACSPSIYNVIELEPEEARRGKPSELNRDKDKKPHIDETLDLVYENL